MAVARDAMKQSILENIYLKQIEGRCIPSLLSKRICFFFCRALGSPRTEKLTTYKNLKSAGKKLKKPACESNYA